LKIVIFTAISLALLLAGASLATVQPTYAQNLDKDNGASSFAPGQEAKIPGGSCGACAKDFAPGQEAERPGWDPNGAPKYAPGQQGLEAGIIGPDIKG